MFQDSNPQNCDEVMYAFDAPAFVRRAREVEDAWIGLLEACRNARERLLEMPRMRLARLFALGQLADQSATAICRADDLDYLRDLYREWQPQLRAAVKPARSAGELERAKADLGRSFQRFNERWSKYLHAVNLAPINWLRDGYNRYYLLEKECALWSSRIAQQGF
ncbi:MAG TPA: hypothetical protein VGH74_15970, partial [Planctomycetaceae bacterium]